MTRIVLAMSGGVDSSVAAWLLRKAGHEVIGVFMRHGAPAATDCATQPARKQVHLPVIDARPGHKQGCCSATDADDARRVAGQLGIPFYALDFQEEFGQIIDYFVAEYSAARTPNPCVVCNNRLKFGRLFDYADGVGAEFVATGHYARLLRGPAGPALCRGVDESKDQSYVLFGVARNLLHRMLLPVGDYRKDEIREFARELGMRVADKRDSQEICFVPDNDHAAFIRRYRGAADSHAASGDAVDSDSADSDSADSDSADSNPADNHPADNHPADNHPADNGGNNRGGEIVTTDGQVVGRHDGLERFTIGQRKGLGIALGQPRFVVRLESDTRRVVLGTHEELGRRSLYADRTNWLADEPAGPFRCLVKIRYNGRRAAATAEILPSGRLRVDFDEPQFGVAPGQAVVCYEGEQLLGGGWIESSVE
jgi:tRNA-specific 2-thiouridylase